MTNKTRILAVGLAVATLLVVLPFLQGVLLGIPGFATMVTEAGLAPLFGVWFGPVVPVIAVVLAAAAFALSWKQKSFAVAGLLAASGIIFMVTSMIATAFFAVIVVPGPILGVIFGLAIIGLGAAKGVRTARIAAVTSRS